MPLDSVRPRPLTSRDIARQAGVSQATVSRVLNNHPSIAPETRARVLDVLSASDYRPNELARSLITQRANAIGVVVDDITNPFYPELVDRLADMISSRGYRLQLWKTSGDNADELIRALQARMVDGMIFTAAKLLSPAVKELAGRGYPLVLVNRYTIDNSVDRVFVDTAKGARLAADHLLELGHREFAIIAGIDQTSTNRDMLRGFVERLKSAGVPPSQYLVRHGNFTYQSGYDAGREIFAAGERPVTAVFAMSDAAAIGVMNATTEHGLRVPEDVSVVGFDDIAMADWPMIRLTTIAPVDRTLAGEAVRLVLDRIESPERTAQRVKIAPSLVVRNSTAAAPKPRSRRVPKKQARGRQAANKRGVT